MQSGNEVVFKRIVCVSAIKFGRNMWQPLYMNECNMLHIN